MPGGLGYDEQGSLATYFALTFLSLAIIPSTLWSLRSTGAAPPSVEPLAPSVPPGMSAPPAPPLHASPDPLVFAPHFLSAPRPPDKSQKKAINELPVPEKRRKAQKARLFGRAKAKGRAVSRRCVPPSPPSSRQPS